MGKARPSPRGTFPLALVGLALGLAPGIAADDAGAEWSMEQIVAMARPAVVIVTHEGRSATRDAMGTGFIVAPGGLVATNLHVIGEGRTIQVRTAAGAVHAVTEIHATDRTHDLAILRVAGLDQAPPPLPLGADEEAREGQPIIAIGNPLGLTHSVVAGVISAKREVEGRPMLQVALPVEPGNSGGPLLDRRGRVIGVITMKSAVTANLGFAVPARPLAALLAKPNPVPMERWVSLGALDPKEWSPRFGAHWRKRAGRIVVDGIGTGFGGRSLCLREGPLPPAPFELAVAVKLNDEAGAAGLVFCSDGGDKHYGFYPSGGRLRFSRFNGPDLESWTILAEVSSEHYRPGDWNRLKVRIEPDRFVCFVNDQRVLENADQTLPAGMVGMAKFRDTRAEFRHFQLSERIEAESPTADILGLVDRLIASEAGQPAPNRERALEALIGEAKRSVDALRLRASELERQARRLRQTADQVHQRHVRATLVAELSREDAHVDIVRAALLVARLDNEEVDLEAYEREVASMADEVAALVPKIEATVPDEAKLRALDQYLFQTRGFHGSRGDYYNRANSFLNEVIDDREGLPITLSVLYLELGRRLGVPLVGVGLPGHFVVRHEPGGARGTYIDVFDGGKRLTEEEATRRVAEAGGEPVPPESLATMAKRDIIARILRNLFGVAQTEGDLPAMHRYLDTLLDVAPDQVEARLARAALRLRENDLEGALADIDVVVERAPPEIDLEPVLRFREMIQRGAAR